MYRKIMVWFLVNILLVIYMGWSGVTVSYFSKSVSPNKPKVESPGFKPVILSYSR